MSRIENEYKFIRKIGQGGMAQVWEARHIETGKSYAIKKLRNIQKTEAEIKRDIVRFSNELKTLRKINSDYVMKFIDADIDSDNKYIVMELIRGEELKDVIRKQARLNIDSVVEYSKQLALGFAAIHKAEIIHRDIKSSNIMIADHNHVKIIDFGIAVSEETINITRTDNVIGSVLYIPPELLAKVEPSIQSDVYSLGILMFEMLTGNLPFRERTAAETAMKHRDSEVPWVNKILVSVPQSFANIIKKATAKDKSKRYATMIELYNDLDTCLNRDRINEKPINLYDKPPMTLMSIVNSKGFLIGMLVVIIILLIGAVVGITLVLNE